MDTIFKALDDPTRRSLLDALRRQDGQTLTQLERRLDMTRFGVMKHLKILEDAGLVVSVRRGRFKHHYLDAAPLQHVIDRWAAPLLARPAARALRALKSDPARGIAMFDTVQIPDFVQETFIRCTRGALWDALTKADRMAACHFACTTVEGDAFEGVATTFRRPDGAPMLVQTTSRVEPRSLIEMTFEPKWYDGAPPSPVVYRIAEEGPVCKLTIEHETLPATRQGMRDYHARWASSLKSWLETGRPLRPA